MASFNNEDCIADCLKSVNEWVDEIIVVDGHSTDKTAEIAKKLGAMVLLRPNNPIFHIQKSIANQAAKSDWILQLDTDEIVTPGLKKEILGILKGEYFGYDGWISPLKSTLNKITNIFPKPRLLEKPASAYWLPRKNLFLNRYLKNAGQYPDPVIRLFQRGKAFLPAKDVHEQMQAKHLKDQGVRITLFNTVNYLFIKPLFTFLSLYVRHRGLLDGFPGFVFSLYSGLHHAFSYMKLWELYKDEQYGRKD
ncbi:MAG: Glycosyl transferase family [Candidatus Peregrinibacteria bacterium GW2011_GWA2_54_9]|nr:MAG: Glycosyl transferase family [Candidatus Peregrinibacteria bacterium GW2011_GWA2_54_9]